MASTSKSVNWLTKALALFENGIPTQEVYIEEILIPRRSSSFPENKTHSVEIEAIGRYISAYHGLKDNIINHACVMVLDDPNFKDVLPKPLSLALLIKLREHIINEAPIKPTATRSEILKNEANHAAKVITNLVMRLSNLELELDIDDQNGGLDLVIYDSKTGDIVTYDISDL